ncbi:unnamed protein product [Owenia fusiformis]|uniref:Transmembrane protein 107 n=1 Tax=Owenia fusiformis TaxID=6347 RepID=A0A8J1TS76_OWEFU|nr:unnamed protein product [Owenia fusiformis]
MGVSGLVPARFLTLTAHLILVIVILWSREENVKSCLPLTYTQDEYTFKDNQLIIGLSVALGLFVLELVGFFGGFSTFMPSQAMISTAAHASGAVAMSFFIFDLWECDTYWWIFGFCSAFPALTEIIVLLGVLVFHKGL